MTIRRSWWAVAIALLLGLVFSACGPEAEEPEVEKVYEEVEAPVVKEVEEEVVAEEEAPATGAGVHEPGSVAILVVDDFVRVEEEERSPPQGDCVALPDGQAVFWARGAAVFWARGAGLEFLEMPDVTHGWLVVETLWQLLEKEYERIPDPTTSAALMDRTYAWQVDDWRIYIVEVDTGGYDTELLMENIDYALEEVRTELGVERFVLNMSFAIVPCDPEYGRESIDDEARVGFYRELIERDPTLEEYMKMISGETDLEELEEYLWELVAEGGPGLTVLQAYAAYDSGYAYDIRDDPLVGYLKNWVTGPDPLRVIPVGAAGNSALDYPFAPALWDWVVSVSAEPASADGESIRYSNWGEVKLTGALQTYYEESELTVFGTSFAAPELSYWAAHYLLWGGTVECDGIAPTLAYAQTKGSWDNLELEDASLSYCPGYTD